MNLHEEQQKRYSQLAAVGILRDDNLEHIRKCFQTMYDVYKRVGKDERKMVGILWAQGLGELTKVRETVSKFLILLPMLITIGIVKDEEDKDNDHQKIGVIIIEL